MLDTLRVMLRLLEKPPTTEQLLNRLSRVPLWTSLGWRSDRPVYAVDDPPLAAGLERHVPVWRPGGEVAQFEPLFDLLKVRSVPADAGTIVAADDSPADEVSTNLFASAIEFLGEDFARNDQTTYDALRISWSTLRTFEVHLAQSIEVRVDSIPRVGIVTVTAGVDPITKRLFLTDVDHLARVDIGGRAVAGLFNADHRRVSQAWLAAVERARSNRDTASQMELASERERESRNASQAAIKAQLTTVQEQAGGRRKARDAEMAAKDSTPAGGVSSGAPAARSSDANRAPRVLVDPSLLRVVNPEGTIVEGGEGASDAAPGRGRQTRGLRDPQFSGRTPQSLTTVRSFTELEKEATGLDLARMVLCSDDRNMVDIRAQRGVGADAFDEFRQFFELKAYAGREPDEIRLETSQIQRALTTPHFFIVVVSNLEESDERPRVRVIAEPLTQLHMVESSQICFNGVTSSVSLVFDLTR
jgi:hypothetical protein